MNYRPVESDLVFSPSLVSYECKPLSLMRSNSERRPQNIKTGKCQQIETFSVVVLQFSNGSFLKGKHAESSACSPPRHPRNTCVIGLFHNVP